MNLNLIEELGKVSWVLLLPSSGLGKSRNGEKPYAVLAFSLEHLVGKSLEPSGMALIAAIANQTHNNN